jgi:bacterioferritin
MASQKLLDIMNKSIARELQVSIQYMWQHVQWSGVKGFTVHDELKHIAMAEMKHAERIAERLCYLGGTPTTKPEGISVGANLKEMIEYDIKAEDSAIKLYRQAIEMAEKEGDITTAHIFVEILMEEEGHQQTFTFLHKELK